MPHKTQDISLSSQDSITLHCIAQVAMRAWFSWGIQSILDVSLVREKKVIRRAEKGMWAIVNVCVYVCVFVHKLKLEKQLA